MKLVLTFVAASIVSGCSQSAAINNQLEGQCVFTLTVDPTWYSEYWESYNQAVRNGLSAYAESGRQIPNVYDNVITYTDKCSDELMSSHFEGLSYGLTRELLVPEAENRDEY